MKLDAQPWTAERSCKRGRQARDLAPDRARDRRRRDALFRRRADADEGVLHPPGAGGRLHLGRHPDLHDLRARRPHARAGLPLHVPVAAHPGGADRQRGAQRHLPPRPRRTAHVGQGRRAGARARRARRRLRRLPAVHRRLPDRHRHPQGPAARLHQLRPVHRRLRRGDDQDQASDPADRLRQRREPRTARARRAERLSASSARGRSCTPC